MKKIIIVFIAALIVQIAKSQADYRPGYYISFSKDTVRGIIKYGITPSSFRYCSFRDLNGKDSRELSPDDISGYGFPNDIFFTAKYINQEGTAGKSVFMEVLVKGKMSLLKYNDTFYVEKADSLYELTNKKQEVIKGGQKIITESNKYLGQLYWLMNDCAQIRNEISKVRLFEKPLVTLVMNYNKCLGSESFDYKQKKHWSKIDFGIMAGAVYSNLNFKYSSNLLRYVNSSYNSVSPFAGIKIGISSPRISNKVSFQTELHFFKSEYSSSIVKEDVLSTKYYDMNLSRTALSVPLSFMYSSSETKNCWFAQAGLVWDYNFRDNMRFVYEEVERNVVTTSIDSPFYLEHIQFGYWAGCGYEARFRKFSAGLALRYYSLINSSREDNITAQNNKFTVSIIITTK